MRSLLATLLLAACTSSELGPGAPDPAPPPAVPRVLSGELMLRRTLCYGECPSYTAIIDLDGKVFYHGREHAERRGLHTGVVDPVRVERTIALALDNGYFDAAHAYEEQITDHPTFYTSVIADGKRQWVSNYARAAPESVQAIETGIDALLGYTSWDAKPQLPPTIGDEPCLEFGRAIEERCKDVLTLRARGGDCTYWFSVWNELGQRDGESLDQPPRCARHLHSFGRTAAPTLEPLPERKLGPKCRVWFAAGPDRCHRDLLRGELGSCYDMDDGLDVIASDLHDRTMDLATRQRIAEVHCDLMN
jgi:hypothetical protein